MFPKSKLYMKKILVSLLLFLSIIASSQTWTNPLTLPGEWYLYGIGDPYILKYRGTYYLYCSTKDNNTGVKCWSTKDFVTWSNAITCSTDAVTKGAYAPEVFYWNGTFYMYTSPAGNGHYVLTSSSPTGPFTVATSNFGKSIDGSVFVNDDGNWYFYHADGNGIMGCPMTNPTTVGSSINLNARMNNNWTEGPCVFKRNGIYYLIYTGNHVISKGYRIDYAKSVGGPVSSFTPQAAQNPILIKTEGSFVGLGHGSAFVGPDLDSYYFTYHNLAGDYGVGPYRRLNFDRIAWNGDKMLLLGPTTWVQQAMQLPDMVDYFDRNELGESWSIVNGGNWLINNQDYLSQSISNETTETWHKALNNKVTSANYTAEFSVKEVQRENNNARYGVVFGYTDEQNYGVALLHSNTNQLEVNFLINNVWATPRLLTLPSTFNHNAWHGMRIEKAGSNYKFFVDGMLKLSISSELGGGRLGYLSSWSQANFGYIAYSNKVNGSGIFDTYKPIPGAIEAVHYNLGGEGKAYHDLTPANSGGKYIRNDSVDIRDCAEGGHAITANQTGEWYKYNVNVKSTGMYNVGIRYSASSSATQIRIWMGDTDISGVINLATTGGANYWRTYTVKELPLTKGYQTLKIETVNGEFDFYKMQFEEADNAAITKTDDFSTYFSTDWNYSDGTWTVENGQASVTGYGKRTLGDTRWSDYTVQTDITYKDAMNAGIIFRVNNPALGGAGKDAALGTDFYQGYFVTLGANSVVLGKQNYNWTQLATASGTYSVNTKYSIRVVVAGANIKVFVNDMNTAKIDYTDPNPIISGKVGYRSHNANVLFDNFSVSTSGLPPTAVEPTSSGTISIFPNPVQSILTVQGLSNSADLTVFDMRGMVMQKASSTLSDCTFDLTSCISGMYFLKINDSLSGISVIRFLKE